MAYSDTLLVPTSIEQAEAAITAIDHAHRTGGFRSPVQADRAREHRLQLRQEVAFALLAAAGADV